MRKIPQNFGNMNFRNFDRNQNLFLFFEENENEKFINSRLVNLYMNRFVIDEDYQNEIIEVFQQKRVVPGTFQYRTAKEIYSNSDRRKFIQQVRAKRILDCVFDDECLLSKAPQDGMSRDGEENIRGRQISKIVRTKTKTTRTSTPCGGLLSRKDQRSAHFIIASDFPRSFIPGEQSHWIEKWFKSKLETHFSQSISIAVTILSGSTEVLASSSLLNQCFLPKHKRNRLFDFFHRWYSEYNTVNNDLETREDEMQRIGKDFACRLLRLNDKKLNTWPYSHTPYGRIHINPILNSSAKILFHHKYLWLYQMLSDSEIEKEWKVKNVSPTGPIHVLDYSENPNTTRFHRIYDCQRLTMFCIAGGETV